MNLERHWYRSSHNLLTAALLPLSWVFRASVSCRRFLYSSHYKKTQRLAVPVIVVGNITVGGTGKTPFVIWLANFLRSKGFRPGIVSRGVGGKQQAAPRWVEKNSLPQEVGDEAVLLASRCQCPVVVGIDRVRAAKELLAYTDCNVVISDDGLQHYRLGRDIEIAIVDGARGLGNKSFLPAGPLRESPRRLLEVDVVVEQVSHAGDVPTWGVAMLLQGTQLTSLKHPGETLALDSLAKKQVHAVAAIGNPARFFAALRALNLEIEEHVFPDHYLYQASDFAFGDDKMIVMTEKDAVKCREFADERFWCLPVEMRIEGEVGDRLMRRLHAVLSV